MSSQINARGVLMDPNKVKQLEAYQKGDEFDGYTIFDIVGRNDKFMVYTVALERGIGVRWGCSDGYDFTEGQLRHVTAFNERYDMVKKVFLGENAQVEALALALFAGLCSPNQDSGDIFKAIDARIATAREEASSRTRAVYGGAAAVTAVVLFPLLLWIASLNMAAGGLLGQVPPAALLVCAAFGILGALTSVLQKLRQVEVSHYPGFFTAAFGGCSRILLGSIFGVVAFLAAKAGLLLQSLLAVAGGDLLIGFGAGVSERLVPELLESIESRTHRDNGDVHPTTG
jgi:hypothetical protein